MNERKMAEQILYYAGGAENIVSMTTCTIRLRLVLKDAEKMDVEGIKKVEGISDVIIRQGMHQLVIGLNAGKVLAEIKKLQETIS